MEEEVQLECMSSDEEEGPN